MSTGWPIGEPDKNVGVPETYAAFIRASSAEAVHAIDGNYERHSRRVREIALASFDEHLVLPPILGTSR